MGIFTLILNHYKNYFRSFEKVKPTDSLSFFKPAKKKSLAKHFPRDDFLYCSKCGSKLIKACKFCTKCGANIKAVAEEKSTENDSRSKSRSLSMIILILKVMKELGFSSVTKKNKGWKPYKQEINFKVFVFSQRNGYNQYRFDEVHR